MTNFQDNSQNNRFFRIPILLSPVAPKEEKTFGVKSTEILGLRTSLLNRTVYGLLDSGAAINCLGGKLAGEIIEEAIPFKNLACNVNTADGTTQKIVGSMSLEIEYGGEKRNIEIFIVPSLQQDLYLGIDFCRKYNLLLVPNNLHVEEMLTC